MPRHAPYALVRCEIGVGREVQPFLAAGRDQFSPLDVGARPRVFLTNGRGDGLKFLTTIQAVWRRAHTASTLGDRKSDLAGPCTRQADLHGRFIVLATGHAFSGFIVTVECVAKPGRIVPAKLANVLTLLTNFSNIRLPPTHVGAAIAVAQNASVRLAGLSSVHAVGKSDHGIYAARFEALTGHVRTAIVRRDVAGWRERCFGVGAADTAFAPESVGAIKVCPTDASLCSAVYRGRSENACA